MDTDQLLSELGPSFPMEPTPPEAAHRPLMARGLPVMRKFPDSARGQACGQVDRSAPGNSPSAVCPPQGSSVQYGKRSPPPRSRQVSELQKKGPAIGRRAFLQIDCSSPPLLGMGEGERPGERVRAYFASSIFCVAMNDPACRR
jgi:hypothetical protein